MIALPTRTRSRPRGKAARTAEVGEELGAALVLVDAADVDRERPFHPELAAEPLRLGALGISEPTPTTTPGTDALLAAAWIIARSSGELS